jgi:FdhD/NarQ family
VVRYVSIPEITNAKRPLTTEVKSINERGERVPTPMAGEHPLTLYIDKREIVTLMTLGQAPEALALGYLRNQRPVRSIYDIAMHMKAPFIGACQVIYRTFSRAHGKIRPPVPSNRSSATTLCLAHVRSRAYSSALNPVLPPMAAVFTDTVRSVAKRNR